MSQERIFISYRRSDSAGWAGRLHADLQRRLDAEQVFRDVTIPPGVDFVEHIERVLDAADIVIAVIGPQWATAPGPDGRPRLQDPSDLVRIEIQRALDRPDVRVVPVLVDGARMPTAADLPPGLAQLGRRNAFELTDKRWNYDVGDLCRRMLREPIGPSRRFLAIGAAVATVALGAGAAVLIANRNDGQPATSPPALTDDNQTQSTPQQQPPLHTTTTPIDVKANSAVWARQRIWMTSSKATSLIRLVGDTNKREKRVPLPNRGSSIAALSGSLWVTSEKPPTVTQVDLDAPHAKQWSITLAGGRPLAVAADHDTGIWVGIRVRKDRHRIPGVVRIDPQTRKVTKYYLPRTVQHLAAGFGAAWVIYRENRSRPVRHLIRIDAAGKQPAIRIRSTDPQRVAVGSNFVWVTNGKDGTVTRIRPRGREWSTIQLPEAFPLGIAVAAGNVWVADTNQSELIQINAADRAPVRSIKIDDPVAVAAHGRHVWVTTHDSAVVRVDLP